MPSTGNFRKLKNLVSLLPIAKVDFHDNCSVGSAIFWLFIGTSSSTPASVEVALEHKISTAMQSLSENPRPHLNELQLREFSYQNS